MTRLIKRISKLVAATGLLALGLVAPRVFAASADWNLGKDRLAIQGYDPVAYFPEGGGVAVNGDPNIATEYRGVAYRL